MAKENPVALVSVHGGHSGQFCNHARDSLEDIIKAYLARGFSWVGITEHMPPADDKFLYRDEVQAGLNAESMYARFADYISTCRELQQEYAGQLEILVGFETETYRGSNAFIQNLIREFKPDYIVGSLHHVNDTPYDTSPQAYRQLAQELGGLEAVYCQYFDLQYDMINQLQPQVIGHFDRIRIFDTDYEDRLQQPQILERVRRNLQRIKALGLILDFNLRAWAIGAREPYPAKSILLEARELDIPLVPGDDSHGVANVGLNLERGIALLQELGLNTSWARPA